MGNNTEIIKVRDNRALTKSVRRLENTVYGNSAGTDPLHALETEVHDLQGVVATHNHAALYYTRAEVDTIIDNVISNVKWKGAVDTYADIFTTYPVPQEGWLVPVNDIDTVYRFDGSTWTVFSTSSVPLATVNNDGKISAADYAKLLTIETNANLYVHSVSTAPSIVLSTTTLDGATVISDLTISATIDNEGHVVNTATELVTRELTLPDIGYVGEVDATADQTPVEILQALLTQDTVTAGLNAGYLNGLTSDDFANLNENEVVLGNWQFDGDRVQHHELVHTSFSGFLISDSGVDQLYLGRLTKGQHTLKLYYYHTDLFHAVDVIIQVVRTSLTSTAAQIISMAGDAVEVTGFHGVSVDGNSLDLYLGFMHYAPLNVQVDFRWAYTSIRSSTKEFVTYSITPVTVTDWSTVLLPVGLHLDGNGGMTFSGHPVLLDNGTTTTGTTAQSANIYVDVAANHTASANEYIYADTRTGSIMITLPLTPEENTLIYVLDVIGSFNIDAVVLGRNGSTIMGINEDMGLNLPAREYKLLYRQGDWRVII